MAPDMSTVRESSEGALEAWSTLRQKTHHEQLNLAKFYEQAGELYLAAGLAAHTTLSIRQAEEVAFSIWDYMMRRQLPLPQAYSAL